MEEGSNPVQVTKEGWDPKTGQSLSPSLRPERLPDQAGTGEG